MLKFRFNFPEQSLAYQKPNQELWYILEPTWLGRFGSLGFKLENGWINFKVYQQKLQAFRKVKEPKVAYYRKDLPNQPEIIFTFSEADQVEKVGSVWVKKGGVHGEKNF